MRKKFQDRWDNRFKEPSKKISLSTMCKGVTSYIKDYINAILQTKTITPKMSPVDEEKEDKWPDIEGREGDMNILLTSWEKDSMEVE